MTNATNEQLELGFNGIKLLCERPAAPGPRRPRGVVVCADARRRRTGDGLERPRRAAPGTNLDSRRDPRSESLTHRRGEPPEPFECGDMSPLFKAPTRRRTPNL